MHDIYTRAHYRATLNWDWDYDDVKKRARWSRVKAWTFKRMFKAKKVDILIEATRSID